MLLTKGTQALARVLAYTLTNTRTHLNARTHFSTHSQPSTTHTQQNREEEPREEEGGEGEEGTEYSKWVLSRSAGHNHEVSYLKRRQGRDRYNIHKLTNMEFMCALANREDKYSLTLNEQIVLLAQMNHVCNVLRKDKALYGEFPLLTQRILKRLQNPEDYVCLGTFLHALLDLGELSDSLWLTVMDALFARKYDEEYDELFGLYWGLYKYKRGIEDFGDYFEIQKNPVIYKIPIVYRNSLEVLRQYVKFNVYNLKECRLLFRGLHQCRVNERHFWQSVSVWFNLLIKQQLQRKQFREFFLVSEAGVDKVLFDDGMIRPRPVLQELAEIAFILSQHGFVSQPFVHFAEHLVLFSIEEGSSLFAEFLNSEKPQHNHQKGPQQNSRQEPSPALNDHIRTARPCEEQALRAMQKQYRTVFVNPTELSSEGLVQTLVVLRRHFCPEEGTRAGRAVDGRLLSWLLVRLCKPEMRFTLNELAQVIECGHFLSAIRLDLRGFVVEKVKRVRSKSCSLDDLRAILSFLPLPEFETLTYILEDFLLRAHPKDILRLAQLIEAESMGQEDFEGLGEEAGHLRQGDSLLATAKPREQRWMPYFTGFFLKLPAAVNLHERYYSFEQNCYFLYLLLKNEEYWQGRIGYQYLGQVEKLKYSIKIASIGRGFKLQMGTYFYKLMNYMDLVAFFDGG